MKVLMLFFTLLVGVIMALPVEGKGLSPPNGVEITITDQVAPEMVAITPESLSVGLSYEIDTNTPVTTMTPAIMPQMVVPDREAVGLFNDINIDSTKLSAVCNNTSNKQDREAIGLANRYCPFILSH